MTNWAQIVSTALVTATATGVITWLIHSRYGSKAAEKARQAWEEQKRRVTVQHALSLLRLEMVRAAAANDYNGSLETETIDPPPMTLPLASVSTVARDLAVARALTGDLGDCVFAYLAAADFVEQRIDVWRRAATTTNSTATTNIGARARVEVIERSESVRRGITASLTVIDTELART